MLWAALNQPRPLRERFRALLTEAKMGDLDATGCKRLRQLRKEMHEKYHVWYTLPAYAEGPLRWSARSR